MTKLWDILKNVGTGIIADVVPGGTTILKAVNAILPEDKQLPDTATGAEMQDAVMKLTPEQQVNIMNMQFEVQLEQIRQQHDTLRTMLEVDATCKRTTRPKIALMIARVYCFCAAVFISGLVIVAIKEGATLEDVSNLWMPVGVVLSPLMILLKAYFGVLKEEHANKLNAMHGLPAQVTPVAGVLRKIGM